MRILLILARLLLGLSATFVWLLWFAASTMFGSGLQPNRDYALRWAVEQVYFYFLPVLVLPVFALFTLPPVSRHTSASFLIMLYLSLSPIALEAAGADQPMPLLGLLAFAALTWFIFRAEHPRQNRQSHFHANVVDQHKPHNV